MKKFLAFLCVITCIFGLTACGTEPVYTEHEKEILQDAENVSTNVVIYLLEMFSEGGQLEGKLDSFRANEIEYLVEQNFQIQTDGYAFMSAISSYDSAKTVMGSIKQSGKVTSRIDGETVIVDVELEGEKKNATAEMVFSNDIFLKLKSVSVVPDATFGELMGKAGLNTLVGMGTVFLVLIFISFIISLFRFIPKLQASLAKKDEKAGENGVSNGIAQIENNETMYTEGDVDESDDQELVAVIAAAIASYEGQTSTDGFVVRSIRRRAV